jgi:hypothetical protein
MISSTSLIPITEARQLSDKSVIFFVNLKSFLQI